MSEINQKISAEQIGHVITLIKAGVMQKSIADIVKVAQGTVSTINTAYTAAVAGDAQTVIKSYKQSQNIATLAVEAAGKNIADFLPEQPQAEAKAAKQDADNTAIAIVSLLETEKEVAKSVDEINRTLKAIQLTIQGFRGETSEKFGKVVEAININADYINKDIEKAVDHLGGIKQNTRKSGYHQP